MKIKDYINNCNLFSLKEIEKVKFLLFYEMRENNQDEMSIRQIVALFSSLGLHEPNPYRLKKNLSSSKIFVKGKNKDSFKLHAKEYQKLEKSLDLYDYESIDTSDEIIPLDLYEKTRGYIELLSKQINSCYDNNIYDGCAVLMRRLIEILLIHTYEKLGIDSKIINSSNNYKLLSDIINDAKTEPLLKLSRNTKNCLDDFRTLGNFSAHKIYYNARRKDVERVIINYRATVEELLYKSGIKI